MKLLLLAFMALSLGFQAHAAGTSASNYNCLGGLKLVITDDGSYGATGVQFRVEKDQAPGFKADYNQLTGQNSDGSRNYAGELSPYSPDSPYAHFARQSTATLSAPLLSKSTSGIVTIDGSDYSCTAEGW